MERSFSIAVLGATGYTGKLVCDYLAKQKEVGSWAIAGRSEEKLNSLKKELGKNVSIRVVDFADSASLDELCSSTKVLISCAGPFTEMGMPVVEACVRCSTHYVDSTGEFNFVRLVIERFHEESKRKGILLVPCCAFDSVPADLGNYVVHQQQPDIREVKAFYNLPSGGMSAGTLRSGFSMRNAFMEADNDPYSLVPRDAERPTKQPPVHKGVWYDSTEKKFTSHFVMSGTNERIVRRTNALLKYKGTYSEALESSLFQAISSTAKSYMMSAVMSVGFVRNYIEKNLLPPSGSGPTEEQRKASWYKCLFVGLDETGVVRRRVQLSDARNGYTASGLYLGEAALSVLQMEKSRSLKSGVLTPMSAFGDVLRNRVEKAGIVINVSDEQK